jgi:hypothetical protein
MTEARKNAGNTPRGKPFLPGNPGKPKGARHKTTLAMEALLDKEGEALTRVAIKKAKAGDMMALRLCMDRLAPARKDRHVSFELPKIEQAADAAKASAAIVQAVADGELTPSEASELTRVLESYSRILEVADHEERLKRLESLQQGQAQWWVATIDGLRSWKVPCPFNR